MEPDIKKIGLELEKIAWRGTYYHGAPSAVEEKILREGLLASKGGTGAVQAAGDLIGHDNPITKQFKKNTKQQVTMSRSRNLARIYGTALDPKRRRNIIAALQSGSRSKPGKKSILGILEGARKGWKTFQGYQPLAVEGRGLTLRRDPDHLLLGVQSNKDIPSSRVSRSTPRAPGWLSKALRVISKKGL